MPESVKIIDRQFRLVFANSLSRQNLGKTLNELRGLPCHQAFYGFAEKCFFCNSKKVFETGDPHQGYTTLATRGVNRDFQVSIFPLWDASHKTVEYVVEVVKDITALSKGAPLPQNAGKITSRDKRFQLVFEQMAHWADDGWPVLLQGEKGTGKKSFARALHQRSGRAEAPFHVFHCVENAGGEFLEGLFGAGGSWEKASGGTLYLDEIGNLGEACQKKMASLLTQPAGPKTPRVVAGTRCDIDQLVHQETFRLDLFNRFASRALRLPSLRERPQDLPFLAQHFIETYRVVTGSPAEKLSPAALSQLMTYPWPGNLRELETQIERACLMAAGPQIEKLDVGIVPCVGEKLDDLLDTTERGYLVDALAKTKGKLQDAALLAGLSQKTLQRKMRKYNLRGEDFRHLSDSST
jgi:DNA-binding NtrC family response regulator